MPHLTHASDLFADQREIVRETPVVTDDHVEALRELAGDAFPLTRQLHGKIAVADGCHRRKQLLEGIERERIGSGRLFPGGSPCLSSSSLTHSQPLFGDYPHVVPQYRIVSAELGAPC